MFVITISVSFLNSFALLMSTFLKLFSSSSTPGRGRISFTLGENNLVYSTDSLELALIPVSDPSEMAGVLLMGRVH